LTANRKDFLMDESMVIFALSYMIEGVAKEWANAYIDKAIEDDNWGEWTVFLDKLVHDFRNHSKPQKALEEMGCLYQGKKTALDYFLHLEQLASVARINVNRSPHVILQLEKGVNSIIIDQLYLSDSPPTNYQDYK
jgi:hypothetical protein